jgi:uncharacterized protein (DUF1501 family)
MASTPEGLTRRSLLRISGSAAGALGLVSAVPSWARAGETLDAAALFGVTTGRRALVCIYLFGGNDSNNLIVPTDDRRFASYAAARGPLALSRRTLLPVESQTGQPFGLHPAVPDLHALYRSGRVAFVANVGATDGVEGRLEHRDADLVYLKDGFAVPSWLAQWAHADDASTPAVTHFKSSLPGRESSGLTLVPSSRRVDAEAVREHAAEPRRTFRAPFPATGIGQQLRQVADLLASGMGAPRQAFFCPLGGFDTHMAQRDRHAALLGELSAALGAFYAATVELGIAEQVTAFTDSEFNRTLRPNRKGGTDHAWGGHQIVVGGSVRGGVYGTFPSLALGGADDATRDGVWVPTTSRAQYAGTLARWYGMPAPARGPDFLG